jgi:hypothetical protein
MKQASTTAEPTELSTEMPGEEHQRQRAMRLDVQISQQAMKVVDPTNQEIGPWQRRAAWLHALAERLKASGGSDPRIAEEAKVLLSAVEKRQKDLRAEISALPADVAASTRLEDTARALDSVASVLGKTLELMKPTRRPRA